MTRAMERGSGGPAGRGQDRPAVSFLARDLVMGGAERAYLHYVNALQSFRPIAVLARRDGALLGELREDVPLFDLSMRPSGGAGLTGPERSRPGNDPPGGFTPRSVARLLPECLGLDRVLRLTRCATVSSFLMRSHLIALLTKRLLRPDLRVVINVHEHMSESAVHLYPSPVDRWLMRRVTRHLFPLADGIVVVADSLRQDLIRTFGVPASLISVVYNPVDLNSIRRHAAEPLAEGELVPDGAPVIVAVGRLVKLKGFDILIRAFARVPASHGARLVLVGAGPDRSSLEALAADLGLNERVRFAGMQRNPWKYMARATVFVLSSLTEAFPSVIGEALALGLPVVAADCSAGVREYLEGTRHGLLVAPGDVESLAGALGRVLGDAQLRVSLAERGPARVAALDLPIAVKRYEDTLAQVFSASGRGGARPHRTASHVGAD